MFGLPGTLWAFHSPSSRTGCQKSKVSIPWFSTKKLLEDPIAQVEPQGAIVFCLLPLPHNPCLITFFSLLSPPASHTCKLRQTSGSGDRQARIYIYSQCTSPNIYSHWLPTWFSKCFKTFSRDLQFVFAHWQLCCCYSSFACKYPRILCNASSRCSHFPNQILLLTHTNSLLDWSAGLITKDVLVCSDQNFWGCDEVSLLSSYTSPSRPYLPSKHHLFTMPSVLKQACSKSGTGWGTKEKEPPD